MIFQEIRTELDKLESSMTQVNNDGNSLLASEEFGDFDDVTQLLTHVNSKWETLRTSTAATELKVQMLTENYPAFTGEFSNQLIADFLD